MTDQQLQKLAQGILQGQRRDLAQAITAVETDESAADTLLSILPTVAGGFRLGLTGAPGVGKPTSGPECVAAVAPPDGKPTMGPAGAEGAAGAAGDMKLNARK